MSDTRSNVEIKEHLKHELYLYHCAGGRTRALMAKIELEKYAFRFIDGVIFWPDGARLKYTKSGDIDYRDWGPPAEGDKLSKKDAGGFS